MRFNLVFVLLAIAVALPSVSFGAPLYTEDFDVDPTANWIVNKAPATTDEAHDFFFNYSTVGIPPAPNSGGTTRGLKMQANQSSGVFGGMSVSPTGLDLGTGNYTVQFDWWANFNGPAPAGGSGSTQLSTFGVGTSGIVAQWPGGTQNSVWFGGTTDGNSTSDWRAYSPSAGMSYPDASPVYAAGAVAGNRNASHAYYAGFGQLAAPAAQTALFPQQTGSSLIGSAPFEWHDVVIAKQGATITWTVDGTLIATVPTAHDTVNTGNNIFFGHSDTNITSSTDVNDVNLLFTLIDNVRVVPEPGTLTLLALGLVALVAQRRR